MDRFLKILLVVGSVLLVPLGGVMASHPGAPAAPVLPQAARPKLEDIDAAWDVLEPEIIVAQKDYFSMTGRYFQGLPTHSAPPDGDTLGEYPAAGWYTHPTDQQYRWADFKGLKLEKIPFLVWIDVYDGPEGSGWVTCVQTDVKKTVYEKCRNYGPEALRGFEWRVPAVASLEAAP